MIRNKAERNGPIVIDLTGPEGNAFFLIGMAENFGKQLDMSREERASIRTELMSGDYENLLITFDKYFGDYVILER
jgi:hypothetical protein